MLSTYEQRALEDIDAWCASPRRISQTAMVALSRPLNVAGNALLAAPGVGPAVTQAVTALVELMQDRAQWRVRADAALASFRRRGHAHLERLEDLRKLDLRDVDQALSWRSAKYQSAALTQGAAAGALGIAGIPADMAALVGLNLRAIRKYATYTGFDLALPRERLFTLSVLQYASHARDANKAFAMAQLVGIARDVARRVVWADLDEHTFSERTRELATDLGQQLTKAKLAQLLPAAGAAVGGAFNAYYTRKVCDAAYYLYRARFLAEKYGPEATIASLAAE